MDVHDIGGAASIIALALVSRGLLWALPLRMWLRTIEPWQQRGPACDDTELRACDDTIGRLPAAIALVYALSFVLHFVILGALVHARPDIATIGRSELIATAIICLAAPLGATVLMHPLVQAIVEDVHTEIAAELVRRGLASARQPTPLATRLGFLAICFVIAPALFHGGITYVTLARSSRQAAEIERREAVVHAVDQLAAGEALDDPSLVIVDGSSLPDELARLDDPERRTSIDYQHEQVTAAAALGDGRWLVSTTPIEVGSSAFWISWLIFIAAIAVWAVLAIWGVSRSMFRPLTRLSVLVQRLIADGNLRDREQLPVLRNDEVGALTREINQLIDLLDALVSASTAVAAGDLRVRFEGRGDLQDAFRDMLARLDRLVSEIREAALSVASAAAEIHSTARAQEHASLDQAERVRGVSQATESVADSAIAISISAQEVLANAERTRSHTDEVVTRSAEFDEHVAGIARLLEHIRDIAKRSDLLALNGSLEATRAREAGRGFALVAGEMRRLAERVTTTVADVRTLIRDIESSSASVVAATRDSRTLADQTARAAMQIVELSEQQSSETQDVSRNTQAIAAVVDASTGATSQTRATADGLHARALELEGLIADFESPGQRREP